MMRRFSGDNSTLRLFLLLVLLAAQGCRKVQSSSALAEVAVFNGLKRDLSIEFKSKQNKISFDTVKGEATSDFQSIAGNGSWNITTKTGPNSVTTLGEGYAFKPNRRSIVAIYDENGKSKIMVIDAGDSYISTLLSNVKNHARELGVDKAGFKVTSKTPSVVTVYWRSENCYKCSDQVLMSNVDASGSRKIVSTKWPIYFLIKAGNPVNKSCSFQKHFEEHGEYEVIVANSTSLQCIVYTRKYPDDAYGPVAAMFGIIAALMGLYLLWIFFIRKGRRQEFETDVVGDFSKPRNFMTSGTSHELGLDQNTPTSEESPKPKRRLQSLDAFRGVAIIVMIFVNYQGGDYYFFEHSIWNGLTVADLVFPWFIFIMGTSIDLSQRALLSKGIRRQSIFKKIVIRSIKLFALGLFLNNGNNFEKWRIPGVLQRFGISYFVVATVSLWMSPSEEKQDSWRRYDWTDAFRDIWMFWSQWVTMSSILAVYLLVTFFVHEKGCPRGYLGPGGIAEHGMYRNCTGGAAGYIDRLVFGTNHMYGFPTCKKIYLTTLHFDPEGLLGCLTSIFLTFIGLQSGRILFTYQSPSGRIRRWLLWGAFWGLITFALTAGTKNEGVIPINKNLWSPSFIFATGSMAYFLLAFMYFVIDVKHWWTGIPFTFAGMNAILLYFGHEVFYNFFPFNFTVSNPTHTTILTRSAVGVTAWMIIAFLCFKEKIFLKI